MLTYIQHLAESRRGFTAALLFAALVKGWCLLVQFPRVINHDGALYITAAQLLSHGEWQQALAQHPLPLYPALITLFHWVIPDWVAAARSVSAAALVLTVIPLYRLTYALHSRAAAFWACLALSGAPMINLSAGMVIRGPAFVFCLAWVLYFTHQARKLGRAKDYFLFLFFCFLSIMLRLEGLVLLVVCGGAILIRPRGAGRDPGRRPKYLFWLLLLAGCVLVLALVHWKTGGGQKYGPVAGISKIFNAPRPDSAGPAHEFLSGYHYIYHQLKELEARSPYPKGDQNFAEIARHFMPLIYLLGVLETLFRVLFPVWLVPLWVGWRRGLARSSNLPVLVAGAFLVLIYGTLIHRDFIQARFLYAPAFCLFPWIGLGLDHMACRLGRRRSTFPLGEVAFLSLFVLLPLIYLGLSLSNPEDRVTAAAGQWLYAQPATHDAGLVTNDLRIPFYAQRGTRYTKFNNIWNDYSKIEEYAHGFRVELIALRLPKDKKHLIPSFKYYSKINDFSGPREYTALYATPEVAARILPVVENGP